MAYSALQLITRSYYLSQIVSRDLQTPTASQIDDGLFLLNGLLDYKSTDIRLIPYFTYYEFNPVANQELYFIPNLLFIDSMTFNIGVVRYSMTQMSRFDYFGTPRVDNIANLPFSFRAERTLGGMNIYIYFLPGGVYPIKLTGKFSLVNVALNTDLSLIFDKFYIEYLRYELARFICAEWGATLPEQADREFQERRKKLIDVSPADLAIRKLNYFTSAPPIDWQTVNLSYGWFPF